MRIRGRLSITGGAVLLAATLATGVAAQELPESYAQVILSGRASAVSKESLEINGLNVRLSPDTVFKGVDARGRIVDLKPSDLSPGLVATVFLESRGSAPVAVAVYRGEAFSMRGIVSDLLTGEEGYVDFIILDGRLKVDVRDALAGGSGDEDMAPGGQPTDDTVDVGDEIVLEGIAEGGIFHAVFARVSAQQDGDEEEGEEDQEPVEVSRRSRGARPPAARLLAKGCRGPKAREGRAQASGDRETDGARLIRSRKPAGLSVKASRRCDHSIP